MVVSVDVAPPARDAGAAEVDAAEVDAVEVAVVAEVDAMLDDPKSPSVQCISPVISSYHVAPYPSHEL